MHGLVVQTTCLNTLVIHIKTCGFRKLSLELHVLICKMGIVIVPISSSHDETMTDLVGVDKAFLLDQTLPGLY